jgi:hypothetical protein
MDGVAVKLARMPDESWNTRKTVLYFMTKYLRFLRYWQPDISLSITYNLPANGGDRLRQGFGRPTDAMPGYSMQLVKTRREKTIANSNEFALAA